MPGRARPAPPGMESQPGNSQKPQNPVPGDQGLGEYGVGSDTPHPDQGQNNDDQHEMQHSPGGEKYPTAVEGLIHPPFHRTIDGDGFPG